MICINCSAELPDNALFCHICGAKQTTNDEIISQINAIEERLSVTGCCFSNSGRVDCQGWIEEYGFEEVCTAVSIALKQYLLFDSEDKPIRSSADEVFQKIPGICYNRRIAKKQPYLADVQRMVKYASKKFSLSEYRERNYRDYITRILYLYSKRDNYTELFEEFFWNLKRSTDKWDFLDFLEQTADELGNSNSES